MRPLLLANLALCEGSSMSDKQRESVHPLCRARVASLMLKRFGGSQGPFYSLLLGLIVFLGLPQLARAGCASNPLYTASTTQTLSGPADSNLIGKQIGSWVAEAAQQYVFDSDFPLGCNFQYHMDRAYATPLDPVVPGLTYVDPVNGKSFPIYATGVPGIGYVVGVRDFNATNLNNEVPLNGETRTYPYPGGPTAGVTSFGFRARVLFVSIGRLATGSHTIPQRNIARFRAERNSGGWVPDPTYLILRSTQINVTAKGCRITSEKNQVIAMPTVDMAVADLGSQTASFGMGIQCDPGVNVHATMTDASNPANNSDVLLPSASSEVKGLGIQLARDGATANQFIRFGPDSSAIGNLNQWFVCNSASGGLCDSARGVYNLNFTARYKRLNPDSHDGNPSYTGVTPGRFDALATITFSYQ